jgi:hypothetical protein
MQVAATRLISSSHSPHKERLSNSSRSTYCRLLNSDGADTLFDIYRSEMKSTTAYCGPQAASPSTATRPSLSSCTPRRAVCAPHPLPPRSSCISQTGGMAAPSALSTPTSSSLASSPPATSTSWASRSTRSTVPAPRSLRSSQACRLW